MSSPSSAAALSCIPQEPEDINRDWLFAVINQFRQARDLALLGDPDDIIDCSIDECESSHGYLSTTYKLVAHFKCTSEMTGERKDNFPDRTTRKF